MSVRFDASTDTLRRTTALPAVTTFSLLGWFKLSADRNDYSAFLTIGGSGGGGFDGDYYVGTAANGTTLISYNPDSDGPNGSTLTVGTWYHVALVRQGTGLSDLIVYLNGVQDTVHAGAGKTTCTGLGIGSRTADANDWLNGCAAAVKIYDGVVLTAAEIVNEMRQYVPKRTANLHAWWPLLSTADDEIDFSGNAKTLTVGGTLATEDGPPIPWGGPRRRIVYVPSAAPAGHAHSKTNKTRLFSKVGGALAA